MTPAQVRLALKLRGTMLREEVARRVGVSRAAIQRLGRELGLSFNGFSYPKELVAEVCVHYAKYGRVETQRQFPGVRVRSIIERYNRVPRQIRWKSDELAEAARMAGLVPMDLQAAMFNRPRAGAGSIRSLWVKRMGVAGGSIHGLSANCAQYLLRMGFPTVATEWWQQRRHHTHKGNSGRKLALWCEMEPWLQPDLPDLMREAVRTMADFQRWLFAPDDPKQAILAMLERARVDERKIA